MSYQEDQELLNSLVGCKVEQVNVIQSSYGDDYTSYIELVIDGKTITFSPRGFNDGSTCLDVDVT